MIGTQTGKLGVGRGRWASLRAGLALTVCCVGGCAQPQHRAEQGRNSDSSSYAAMQPSAEALAEVDRGVIAPDVSMVGAYVDLPPSNILRLSPDAAPRYHALEADDCARRAAATAVLANLLDSERRAVADGRCAAARAATLRRELLALRAADERNRSAGAALEVFYHLAEAEAGRDTVRRALATIDRALDDVRQLRREGLPIDVDATALERQQIFWRSRSEQLARSLDELNSQLSRLVGLDAEGSIPIWPAIDWKVIEQTVDVDAAVEQGLAARADLALLRRLDASLDVDTLPTARGTLMQVDAMLGQSGIPAGVMARVFGSHSEANEISHRREQIHLLLSDRERAATDEIRQAAMTVRSRYRETALAKEYLASWNGRLDDLRKRRGDGKVTQFDIGAAELEVLRAESDLIAQVVAWKIAQVRLRQAQGLLAQ